MASSSPWIDDFKKKWEELPDEHPNRQRGLRVLNKLLELGVEFGETVQVSKELWNQDKPAVPDAMIEEQLRSCITDSVNSDWKDQRTEINDEEDGGVLENDFRERRLSALRSGMPVSATSVHMKTWKKVPNMPDGRALVRRYHGMVAAVVSGRGVVTAPHADDPCLGFYVEHMWGVKLWVVFPATPQNRKELANFSNRNVNAGECWFVEALERLECPKAYVLDRAGQGLVVEPLEIHGVLSLGGDDDHRSAHMGWEVIDVQWLGNIIENCLWEMQYADRTDISSISGAMERLGRTLEFLHSKDPAATGWLKGAGKQGQAQVKDLRELLDRAVDFFRKVGKVNFPGDTYPWDGEDVDE